MSNIYILESRSWLKGIENEYDISSDVFLTFDFAVKHHIEALGGQARYVDQLCDPSEMQANNFLASEFFKKWHYDKFGNEIFTAYGVPFGFAFRIEIWSEYLFYVRLRANLEKVRGMQYETIYVGEDRGFIGNILREMGMPFVELTQASHSRTSSYFFDIHKYMNDALHGRSFRNVVRDVLLFILSKASFMIDSLFRGASSRKTVYMQIYHPTRKIAEHLQKDTGIRVVTASFAGGKGIGKYFFQRLIPIRGRKQQFQQQAESLLRDFRNNRCAALSLRDGTDISAGAYRVIEQQIQPRVSEALQILNSVIRYVDKLPIQLEIMIANIGLVQTIVDCVLKTKGVPSYLIINGLMMGDFLDEAKYADHINGYAESIKRHYFKDAEKVVCLGDPRMDDYAMKVRPEGINRKIPTVSIGTSGFNPIDLTSYVAVEFDFMFDVLSALQQLLDEGIKFYLIIKVRPNGVLEQYADFAKEYFPELPVEIVRETPIIDVLNKTDLYISIYSQTLFEASCLGIPAIYYKKDKETLDPPFDQRSELVTVDTVAGLKQAFLDFQSNHDRFNAFLDKSTMEKYAGFLDGKNLERNLSFIYGLLQQNPATLTLKDSVPLNHAVGGQK
jgi:hypothetical protein